MSNPKSVDPSLWWDPFTSILTDLENAPLSSQLPPSIEKKLKRNHAWFVDTVSRFKPPNAESRQALISKQVKVGSHELIIKPELKDKALHISSYLSLDEVQSYILVERSLESHGLAVDSIVEEYLHVVLLEYYIERQCLLKCIRQILLHALYFGISSKGENVIRDEAKKLISDGLERKLISILQDLLSSSPPEEMDVDLFTLWAEGTLIEDNLVLDILFLIYYESFCLCNGETWTKLCSLYKGILSGSYNFGKLAISSEALKSSHQAKVQLLLILMETLDLENLLQLVHDETPFRPGASLFSIADIQQMDVLVSSFNAYETKEAGPLILTWAVCLCLITSLPKKEEHNVLMEIDHVGYLRQAFESASLNYFLEILDSDLLKESDGPVAGYRSVLRTFVSAFIASYEINLQSDNGTLNLILDILCKIYRGEESLCNQFWDKESFIDGPIRCLLCSLEGEFPFRTAELLRLLSSLCEGSWPTECVFNFLDKSVGISSLFEITSESLVDNISQIVETNLLLHVPGVEGLFIPNKTRGHVLKVIGGNTAIVRWEYKQSGLLILLLRLAQELYLESNDDVFLTLDLLSRMVSFSTAVTFSLMDLGNSFYFQDAGMNRQMERNSWVVDIICAVIKNLSPTSAGAAVMSMGVSILAKMLKCSPSHVAAAALKSNIFEMTLKTSMYDVGYDGIPSNIRGSWMLPGKLAKMLLIDCEQNDFENPLTISVLEFTMRLVETRLDNDLVLALVVFCLQYILINHEQWKYKVKLVRWRVSLKVLELMKTCIMSISFSEKSSAAIRDILLCDSSIHSVIFRLICTTKQSLENLYVSRLVELVDIDGFQCAISSALDILYIMLSKFSEDLSPGLPVFHQAVLSSSTKPIPVVSAVMSLISFTRNPEIQVGAAKVLSSLLNMADYLQPYFSSNMCFGLDDEQIADFRHSVKSTLLEQMDWNEDLFVAIVNLLTAAASHQPPFLVAILAPEAVTEVQSSDTGVLKQSTRETSNGSLQSHKSSLLDALMQNIEKGGDFINSNPRLLVVVLDFLKALWQGAAQYINILESLKSFRLFWKKLSNCISLITSSERPVLENLTEKDAQSLAYKYRCQSVILEIMAYEMFLKKKLLHAESLLKEVPRSKGNTENAVNLEKSKSANDCDLKDIMSSWCDISILGNLIKSYTCEFDNEICYHAKVAATLFVVQVMVKLGSSDAGSLSISLLEKIRVTFESLTCQPAFSELLAQYSQRGYSEGKELKGLILNDLYYHLQGELEGRKMGPGPFKELSLFLVESKCLQIYQQKYSDECLADVKDIYLYDLIRIKTDLGLDMWDYTEWKEYKAIAETMLGCMQQMNSMVILSSSKLSMLKALITVLTMYEGNLLEKKATTGGRISDQLFLSCIDHMCRCFHVTVESLAPVLDASEEILNCVWTQAELLLHLVRLAQGSITLPACALVLKTSGVGLKAMTDFRSSISRVGKTVKILLMLLLFALEFSKIPDKESEGFAEISNVCLGLLPILCECTTDEHCGLSLTTIDLILKSFLTPKTWFPIIQKHLQLLHVILKLHEDNSPASIPIKLKFLLTLARVREGAELLLSAGFLSSLQVLFGNLLDGRPSTMTVSNIGFLKSSEKDDKSQHIWGLGLAVVTAMVHSLKDSSCTHVMENVIPYLFSEKANLISYYLDAPDFPSDNHDKKRSRAQRTQTSLNALKETEHTLLFICTLAKHWNVWVKAMKEMDSQLREKSVHLLAFISRGTHHLGESTSRMSPLLCPPMSKEEFECCNKPSFINSRNGWFALSPICCAPKPKPSAVSATSTALAIKSQSTEITGPVSPSYFSDLVGLQIYRIAFLLLKFLCLEAEGSVKRSEELGFVDLAHIPELPMPEILHGLQDQAITVVSEICNANKLKQVHPEIQDICLMLLQIMEMALYLELCVLQICGIRPVLGRVEDFSKEIKLLLNAMEGHAFLKSSIRSLKQIVSLVYPGLLQTEGLL
eukprot:XP_015580313.1 uncharacterized protein LOC8265348 isoform X1 [Ricinus communis]